jgi:ADP-ribosylglycohydrolase
VISSIVGDCIGSRFEFNNDAPLTALFSKKSTYTDDSILTCATCDVILNGGNYSDAYLDYARTYPNRGYGGSFLQWVKQGGGAPYNSYGNGSAMRVSPVGFAFNTYEDIMNEAKKSAAVTHDNEHGIKGAQAVAIAVWMARNKKNKEEIKEVLSKPPFDYDLSTKMNDFPKTFDVTCQGTIPRCVAILLETNNFIEAMIAGIKMGGDIDTNCCIVGGICDALYGLPQREIIECVYKRIPNQMADIITKFTKKYIDPNFVAPERTLNIRDAVAGLFL